MVVWGDAGLLPAAGGGAAEERVLGPAGAGQRVELRRSRRCPTGAEQRAWCTRCRPTTIEDQPGSLRPVRRRWCATRCSTTSSATTASGCVFDTAYRDRGACTSGLDFGQYQGEPLAVTVNRRCADPVRPEREGERRLHRRLVATWRARAIRATAATRTTRRSIFADQAGPELDRSHIQNSGRRVHQPRDLVQGAGQLPARDPRRRADASRRARRSAFDPNTVVGPGWIGSAWIRASQPLGIVVDTLGAEPLHELQRRRRRTCRTSTGPTATQINYAPLIYTEYQGWDTAIQVQNLSATIRGQGQGVLPGPRRAT